MFYLFKISSLFNWSLVIGKQHKKREVKYILLDIGGEYTPVTELADMQISCLWHVNTNHGLVFILFYFSLVILFYFTAVNNLAHIAKEAAVPEEAMTEQQIKDKQLLKV